MFKNNTKDMDVEYKFYKKGLETQGGITDSDAVIYYIDKMQKNMGFLKKMGIFFMILGVPLLLVGIGFILLPGGFFMFKWAKKQTDKYEYLKGLAKADPELNHATQA